MQDELIKTFKNVPREREITDCESAPIQRSFAAIALELGKLKEFASFEFENPATVATSSRNRWPNPATAPGRVTKREVYDFRGIGLTILATMAVIVFIVWLCNRQKSN